MATAIVTVVEGLQIVSQLVPLIQSALAAGETTIDAATWAEALQARNAAQTQLDTDIAAGHGRKP